MKEIKFKKWIPREWVSKNNIRTPMPDTGKYEDDFTQDGEFMAWGMDYEEFGDGIGNYSVALIKLPDGTVEKVMPENIKFID